MMILSSYLPQIIKILHKQGAFVIRDSDELIEIIKQKMSKSVFIKSNIKIEKKTFINLIKEFFIKEDSYDNLLILQFKKKWIWLFFDERRDR